MVRADLGRPDSARSRLERRIADWVMRMALGGDEKRGAWEEYLREVQLARFKARQFESDPGVQRLLVEKCRAGDGGNRPVSEGFWYWCRVFGVVVEARAVLGKTPALRPFIPWFHQEKLLEWVWQLAESATDGNPRTGLVIKSRDQGATWAVLHLIVWCWLYMPNCHILIGSQKEEKVDKAPGTRNVNALLGRVEVILSALPKWMLPAGFSLQDRRYQRQELLIRNVENGNTISGESSNANFGRQNRYWMIFADEFDFMEHAASILGGMRDSSAVQVLVTTPNRALGVESVALRLKNADMCPVFETHWWEHPYKSRSWYETEARSRFEEDLGSELDISWEGSERDLLYPTWKKVPLGSYPFVPRWGNQFVAIDFGRADGTGIAYGQRSPITGTRRWLAAYYNMGHNIDFYLPFLGQDATSGIYAYDDEEAELQAFLKPICKGAKFYGDPAGEHVTQAADKSVAQQLAANGIRVHVNPAMTRFPERQSRCREVLQNSEADAKRCALLDASFRNYKKQRWKPGMVNATRRPLHDWSSHLVTAVEYYAVNEPGVGVLERKPAAPARQVAAWEKAFG